MALNVGQRAGMRAPLLCLAPLLLPLLLLLLLSRAPPCRGQPHPPPPPDGAPPFAFTRPLYHATVYENSAARTYAGSRAKMGVPLRQRSWEVRYRITAGDDEGFFKAEEHVLGDFCFLRVRTKGGNAAILNREIQDGYVLTVKASVKGEPLLEARAKVHVQVLDMNDLRPLFSPTTYSVTVAESTPLRTSIAQVTATDADVGSNGEFYYFFKERAEVELFAVHPTSGVVSLSGRLDAGGGGERGRYDLEILAVDRGMKLYGNNGVSSTAKLFVHVERVNEHAPAVSAVARVPSWSDRDPVYALVAVEDPDEGENGEVESVAIVAGDPLEHFHLERTQGDEFAIMGSESVDWDSQPYGYNLTLQAKDRGSPQKFSALRVVHLRVKKPPAVEVKFEQEAYEVSLREVSPPGTVVTAVKLRPEPDDAEYILTPSADSAHFLMNTVTGVISTARWFTELAQATFDLEVLEVDSELRVRIGVSVEDANDHAPTFGQPSYEVFVNESVPTGTALLTVSAADEDQGENGYITYSISSLQPLPFQINQFTGVLSTTRELDFESSSESFVFVVRASDWGSPYRRESEVNVTVRLENVNDNQPLFEKVACQGAVPRDLPTEQVITTMSAIDIDELELVKYKILSGNEKEFFELNPDSGVLTLKRSLASASPRNGVFSLKITATDGEHFSDPMFVNISLVQGRSAARSFNCKETRVAQKLAEKLLKKSKASAKPKMEEGFIDLFSVNRQTPQFDKAFPADIAVREDLQVGADVFRVRAYDGDTGFNGQILYAIAGGNVDSCFAVDMDTGWLRVFLPLDREKRDRYLLNLTVYDLGAPRRAAWRLLTVYVEDANDNAPQFLREGGYRTAVPENTAIGTEVIQVEATDKDLGPNGEIAYSLLTSTAQFGINATSGVVYVAGQLDREQVAAFDLKVEARDKAERGSQRFSVTSLRVTLEDVNDCPPAFVPAVYHARALEDLPVGTVVAWLDTQDPDLGLGGQVRYSLANDYDGTFEVDKASGAVRLAKELDFETQQFYNLSVRAKDRGRPVSLLSVSWLELEVVDVNENLHAPYFSHFALSGSVKEGARVGTTVLQVAAQDEDDGRDGEIQYSIRDGSGLGRFAIDEETGVIYTTDTLDRETQDSYWLTVYATDHGVVPQYASLEVYVQVEDVNDNAPLTSEPAYRPVVMENAPKDVSVIQIQAQDPDAAASGGGADRLSYRIASGNPQNFFTINPRTGLITTTSRKLDREQQAEHVLEVTVSDGGASPKQTTVWVMVQVLDENDNKPVFSAKMYQIKLPERERRKKGEPIYRAFAYDRDEGPNADLSYSIVDGNEDGKFFIDPKTAVVSSRKQFSAGSYDILTIKATDNGRPQKSSTARLHIEWIRRPPPSPLPLVFDEPYYNFTVMENDPVAEIVGVVSIPQGPSPLWFDITGGNTESLFDVEKAVGTIVIAKPLDAEQRSFYNMTVEVTDGTNTASTQVHITVLDNNDNTPVFSQPTYEVVVSEDTPPDTEVVQVLASDRDESHRLAYSLHGAVDPASLRLFRVDPAVGTVYTTERLDHEARAQHILTVMVKDQEFPYRRNLARVLVEVEDVNDHVPLFTSALYEGSVYESAALGSAVVQVMALDKDKGENAELTYAIEGGNTGNTFRIEPVLGIISVARDLDLSTIGHYVLTVRASDRGSPPLSTTTVVRIAVTLSDNAGPKFPQPEYQAEVMENVAVGTSVTTVGAASQSTLTYDIRHGNADRAFRINQYSGVVTTQRPLDYEATPLYTLTVQATNMAGMASNATLVVQVTDQNDNPPVFQQPRYRGSISEAAPVNSVVLDAGDSPLVIRATDADRNQNALLVYQIVEDTARRFFTVDSGTGSIRTIANLDHETLATFHFHVHVRDSGRPQLTADSPTEVTIQVVDTNDSPPAFDREAYEAVLLLPTYVGVEALQVSATDPDRNVPTELAYSIADGSLEHFAIEASSGVLTVRNNNFSKERFRFNVKVSDGKLSGTALVTVLVREALDSGLSFTQSLYSSSIQENVTNVTKVAVVNAVGNRLNEPLRYTLLNAGTRFRIRPTSGVIQTTGVPFDREERESYELVVEAGREHDRLRVARVMVRVQVEDINDNAPVFVGLPYYAAVQVEAEPGAAIFRVAAVDRDKGINGEVSYFLRDDHGHFEMDRLSGGLSLKKAFESDLSNVEYQMVVYAKDGGYPPLSSTVEFPITVVNKAMPMFDKSFYAVSVSEDVEVHTPILGINATSPEGQSVIYTIVEGDPSLQFDIGFDTGVISVVNALDYEVAPSYRLTVRATDFLTGARAEVDVDVTVLDVNDSPPVFEKTSYKAVLSEAAMIGTPALQVIATDRDSEKNNAVRYQIFSDAYNSTDYFHIDSSSGLILTARMLDHELAQRYDFIVRATDNGFPPLSSEVSVAVTVNDMNDNPPVFNQLLYEAYVSELAPRGHFVTCVQASDGDSSDSDKLEYSILSGNERMNFAMDGRTGILTLSGQRKQRMEPAYSLNVSVSDGVFTSTAQVHVKVLGANLYSPVFGQSTYEAEIRENAAVGTKVIQVRATDADPGPFGLISYSFVNDVGKDQFAVDSSGQITTLEKLDREDPANRDLVLTVAARDAGGRSSFCTVRLALLDDNDSAPRFRAAEYRASVKSDVARGFLVTQVQALDPDDGANAKVTYSLYSEAHVPVADVLEIDPDNGWMVTKGGFGHLRNSVLSFFVKAVDGGAPVRHSLVSVYIHVLSPDALVPSFSQPQYSFTLAEDAALGVAVGTVRLSPPPAGHAPPPAVAFALVNGEAGENNRDNVLVIDRETGVIKVDKPLDHEVTRAFYFKATATVRQAKLDSVTAVDVELKVLDLNDNKPAFEAAAYEAAVMEGMPVGTRIVRVQATDPDSGASGQVTYGLASLTAPGAEGEPDRSLRAFAIDSNTGWISTLAELDHERDPSYAFAVVASDLGESLALSSSVTVTVLVADVNDNPPAFLEEVYRGSVRESDPPGQVVAVLNTRDDDNSAANRQVSYHITGGNRGGVFALGLVQGEWKMYVKRPLDREEQDLYLINVTASDGLFVARATVEVTVTDTNDNRPVCHQALYTALFPEDVPVNSVILRVGASDADVGVSAWIQYSLHGPGSEDFSIDPETGDLKTAAALDRERTPAYRLVARATDGGGLWCRAEVHLALSDVNDNPPAFSLARYTASVYEDTPAKALLTRIQAIDPDEGPSRKVLYSLTDSAGGAFSIDESSGVVVLERGLDRELRPSYQITVRASDQGSPRRLSSLANVTVTVLDVNDNPPVFERRDQLATVPEDVGPGTEVIRVYAASKDIGTNAEITYSIRSGNEHGKFHIHPLTGAISVSKALDYETCRDYFLTVEARDGGTPPLSAVTTVNINLTDVNDNAPMFSRDGYAAVVSEDSAVGASVVQLTAEDVDSQVNGDIIYSIVSGDGNNQFFIDPLSGMVKVNKQLDREMVSGYSLAIRALDSGSPPMSSTVMVTVDVSDINDNPPTFSPANLSTVIQENKPIGTSILQLSVIDQDSSHNGPPFDFRILSGNEGGEFVLEEDGTLLANQVFRRDLATEYLIQVQVRDSGKPRLSSSSSVTVRVIEESLHRPVALPLEVHIVTMEDEFPGGVIGQLHATDADPYDALTFGHAPPAQRSLFKISPRDGKIIALGGLDAGRYALNASVSDGRFAVPVSVSVHVEQASPAMLRDAVTVRFESVAPHDFVASHLEGVARVLRAAAAPQKQDRLHVLSLQPVGGTRQLDLLVAVETVDGAFYKAAYLTQKLSASRRQLEEVLRVSAILDKNCSGLECRGAQCEQSILLDSHSLVTYSTPRVSFVSPRFHRTSRCACSDGSCPPASELCDEQPCPGDMQCVASGGAGGPYACQCPPGKLGECAGHTSLSFSGNSYIKYKVAEGAQTGEMKLALRIRTLQSRGIIMYTRAEPCTILKLEEGKLWFQLDCGGDSPGTLGISGRPINDGDWHTVALELNRNFTSLALDDSYVERRRGPPRFQPLGADGSIYFGAQVQPANSRSLTDAKKGPRVQDGFQGCLDSVTLNDHELPLQNKRSRYAEVVGLTELKLGCVLYPDACLKQPCLHGATCTGLPSGGFACSCSPQYTGGRCETEITACVPNPCQNSGVCKPIGNAFLCSCRRGFKGLTCADDVNECERGRPEGECDNGGACVNTRGSFYCNCTAGFVGPRCGLRPVLVPDMQAGHAGVGKEELIGIAVVLFLIVALVVLFVAFRKKVFHKSYSRNNLSLVQDPATAALLHKANGATFKTLRCVPGDPLNLYSEAGLGPAAVVVVGGAGLAGPPQVPVRPMAYTPCFSGDHPRSTLERMADGRGAEHTEMSTFHPESPRILGGTNRRGVVVCSVAPNLPPVSPCRSDCDSIRKSPWDSDEGKMVDMAEEVTCFSGSNKGSNSEVQSLSSFQSDSCDDNAYHWDTSDWMPSTRLPDIEEVPSYDAGPRGAMSPSTPRLGGSTRELESDYYLGGYDIDSDYPPPHEEEYLSRDQLPPPLPVGEEYQEEPPYDPLASPAPPPLSRESTLSGSGSATGSSGRQAARPHFHPSQYLPPHQLPLGEGGPGGGAGGEGFSTFGGGVTPGSGEAGLHMRLSGNASSASDLSAPSGFDDSEGAGSDFDSMDELHRGVTIIVDSQQQTEV
ncbi:protocadherin Fat 3a [Aplochiton taeniatus]